MDPQNKLHSFKTEVFQLVSQNKIPEAIGRLIALYKSTDGTYYDDLLLLSRQYKDLTDRQLSGLLDDDDANIEKNRITHGLINIANNLHTDPMAAKHFGIPVTEQKEPLIEKKDISGWIWLIPLVLMIAIVGVFLMDDDNEEDISPAPQTTQIETPENKQLPQDENVSQQRNDPPTAQLPERSREEEEPKTNTVTREPVIDASPEKSTTAPPPSSPQISAHSSPGSAKVLQSGQKTEETLLSREDVHFYRFLATRDGRVNIKLSNRSAEYSPTLSVINPDGNRLIGTSARKGDHIITWFRAQQGTQYGIRVGARHSDPGQYTLELTYP